MQVWDDFAQLAEDEDIDPFAETAKLDRFLPVNLTTTIVALIVRLYKAQMPLTML